MRNYSRRNQKSNKQDSKKTSGKLTSSQQELLNQTRKPLTIQQRDGTEQTTTVIATHGAGDLYYALMYKAI